MITGFETRVDRRNAVAGAAAAAGAFACTSLRATVRVDGAAAGASTALSNAANREPVAARCGTAFDTATAAATDVPMRRQRKSVDAKSCMYLPSRS